MFGGSSMNIIIIVIVVAVVIFAVVSTIMGRKNNRLEKEKRKKEVKSAIKQYIKAHESLTNLKIEYKKVVARKGKTYKYRDIFDVIVVISEAKTNKFIAEKSFEIEGINKKINKKNYTTDWKVNRELDLEMTRKEILIAENKIKLSKDEVKERRLLLKKQELNLEKDAKKARNDNKKVLKTLSQNKKKPEPTIFYPPQAKDKFIPAR